jgi:hypothetical protein
MAVNATAANTAANANSNANVQSHVMHAPHTPRALSLRDTKLKLVEPRDRRRASILPKA